VIPWRRAKASLAVVAALAVAGLSIWASDRITLQGERTIYGVKCEGGRWEGERCTGRLVPGERHAFRASAVRGEVIYWIRGSKEPSGKYSGCKVVDRDNWTCSVPADQKPAAAVGMQQGRPTRSDDPRGIALHDVPKWKWWLLTLGVGWFTEAAS
jgi:hypothetical protein